MGKPPRETLLHPVGVLGTFKHAQRYAELQLRLESGRILTLRRYVDGRLTLSVDGVEGEPEDELSPLQVETLSKALAAL